MFGRTPAIMGSSEGSKQVESILSQLQSDLAAHKLSSKEQQTLLEQLKVLGRNPANSNAIFAKEGIATLSAYAFDQEELGVAREASRCLANAMLLSEPSRQIFLDLGYVEKAAKRLENDDRDDEFLLSRIIFLMTYKTTVDLTTLVEEHNVAKSICRNLDVHAQRLRNPSTSRSHPLDDMAMSESLKLLFNITYFVPALSTSFGPAVPSIFTILTHLPIPSPPLEGSVSATINGLMNLDLPITTTTTTTPSPTDIVNRLTKVLEASIKAYPEAKLETNLMPLVTILRKYNTSSSSSSPNNIEAQTHLKANLLPSDADREKPLGKDDSLPSRLLRLYVSPSCPDLRKNIGALLFELSDSDPSVFIHNIGYGYASGFLTSNNIQVPESAMSGGGDAATGSGSRASENVNPVTGQFRDREEEVELPEMTDEEKEREAERLFVLFERLKATGVVDVENPIKRMRDEGRFEEIE